MGNSIQNIANIPNNIPEEINGKREWNFNKLQAAVCILASAALSIGLIAWAAYVFV